MWINLRRLLSLAPSSLRTSKQNLSSIICDRGVILSAAHGIATLDDFPDEKSLTDSPRSHCGVISPSLRMAAEVFINWGSGLD